MCLIFFSAAEVANSRNAEIARHVVLKGTPVNVSEIEIESMFGKVVVSVYSIY